MPFSGRVCPRRRCAIPNQHVLRQTVFRLFFDTGDNENFRALLKVYGNFSGELGHNVKFAEIFDESDMLSRCPIYATEKPYTVL